MASSICHHCVEQIKIAEGLLEPPAKKKCRCRKRVTLTQATKMVKEGEASWLVKNREYGTELAVCDLCEGGEDVYNCAQCDGKGTQLIESIAEDYGNDIVLVSRPPADKTEKKRSSALAAKTPRTATIEANHIYLAYVKGVKAAQERIEEYGELNQKFLQSLISGPEPEDDPKAGTGRTFDYGRSI